MCGKNAFLDKERLLLRHQYSFLLSIQGRFGDLILSVCFPLMMLLDKVLDSNNCSITCGVDDDAFMRIMIHFFVYIIFDALLLLSCLFAYSYRFSKKTYCLSTTEVTGAPPAPAGDKKPEISFAQIWKTWTVLWHCFELHVNRYIVLFVSAGVLVIAYVTFNIMVYLTPNPRWGLSSSSLLSSSSDSSDDSVFAAMLLEP